MFTRCNGMLQGVWLLSVFPLFYFREELTSKLTVNVPANHIETLSELEAALDGNSSRVCDFIMVSLVHQLAPQKI